MTAPQRICIYPKDVMLVTGKSERYCRALLQKIKQRLGKDSTQFVTIEEFCIYSGLKVVDVQHYLK